jgi:hypothetical protein
MLQLADRCYHRVDFVRVVGHVFVDVSDGAEKMQSIHSAGAIRLSMPRLVRTAL